MFDKVKELYELKRRADALKRELAEEVIEVERGSVKVVISADMKIREINFPKDISERDLIEAVNRAIEEAQKIAAKKMQGQLGDLSDLLK